MCQVSAKALLGIQVTNLPNRTRRQARRSPWGLTLRTAPDVDGLRPSCQVASRATRVPLGVVIVAFLILLVVVGASAQHEVCAFPFLRGRAPAALKALFFVAVLTGMARSRCRLEVSHENPKDSESRRHPSVLVAKRFRASRPC
jgi:hypothetical protein